MKYLVTHQSPKNVSVIMSLYSRRYFNTQLTQHLASRMNYKAHPELKQFLKKRHTYDHHEEPEGFPCYNKEFNVL